MIRTPMSFDRLGGYRTIEQGEVVIRLDIVRRTRHGGVQTIVSRIREQHARRCCEAVEIRRAAETMAAPTYRSGYGNPIPPAA